MIYYLRNETDGLIGLQYNNEIYYYMKNAQNDIIGILDSNDNVVVRYTYDSWGNIVSITDNEGYDISNDSTHIANINLFRYRSYYYDSETNLYYLNSRYYNPVWGRFINADGIIGANKDVNSYNLYAYCSNNPINNVDFSGNKRLRDIFIDFGKGIIKAVEKTIIGLCTAFTNPIYPTSSQLLAHSLQSNPSDVYLGGNSTTAKQIKNSREFQDAINTIVSENYNSTLSNYKKGIIFENDMDLKLSLHNANMSVSGTLNNGLGNLSVKITDKYDFINNPLENSKGIKNWSIDAINNMAWGAQEIGTISNFYVTVEFDYCVNYR